MVPNRVHNHYRNKDTLKVAINFPIKQPRNGQSDQQSGEEPKNSMTKEDAATELIMKASLHALRAGAAKHENKSKEGGTGANL